MICADPVPAVDRADARASDAGLPIVVTGANRGLGLAVAERLLAGDRSVMLTARDPETLRQRTDSLSGDFAIHGLDVGSPAQWKDLAAALRAEYGAIAGLVCNAGVFSIGSILDFDPEEYDTLIRTNLSGVVYGIRELAPLIAAAGGGSIVVIGSVSAHTPLRDCALYGASKSSLLSLVRGAAADLGPLGVRINLVSPGGMSTDMGAPGGVEPADYAEIPLGRIGRPSEIAEVVEFMLSPRASYVTGAELIVDGGMLAVQNRPH